MNLLIDLFCSSSSRRHDALQPTWVLEAPGEPFRFQVSSTLAAETVKVWGKVLRGKLVIFLLLALSFLSHRLAAALCSYSVSKAHCRVSAGELATGLCLPWNVCCTAEEIARLCAFKKRWKPATIMTGVAWSGSSCGGKPLRSLECTSDLPEKVGLRTPSHSKIIMDPKNFCSSLGVYGIRN